MLSQPPQKLPRRRVPQADAAVLTGAGEHLAVLGECDRVDHALVAADLGNFLAVGRVPELDDAIAASGETFAVGREDHRAEAVAASVELALLPSRVRVPHH